MYDIKQFKPVLYLVVILGLSGFCLAAETPGMWGMAMLGVGVNAWLVRSGRFAPFPRWLANAATLAAVGFVIWRLARYGGAPLLYVGQFLVLMHIIKLFEQRANRDYTQLLVLSLLLMVAASINTSSLLFGLIMVAYLALSLYCCLLFHLKVEADLARQAMPVPPERVSPSTLRQDERFLPRSMRRLTATVFLTSVTTATLVFLFFPRGPGQGVLGQLQFRPHASTGFSDRINLSQINRIRQNDELVAHVMAWRNGRKIEGTEPLFLRGVTLDAYGADVMRGMARPEWTRSPQRGPRGQSFNHEFGEGTMFVGEPIPPGDIYRQRIQLRPFGSRPIFALPGLLRYGGGEESLPAFQPSRAITVRHYAEDNSLQAVDPITQPLDYEILSRNGPVPDAASAHWQGQSWYQTGTSDRVLEQVRQFVERDDVAGDLLRQRPVTAPPSHESNEAIARRIEQVLRGPGFAYTLDLTGARSQFQGRDPVVAFLTDVRRGHCELFASAMVLMCQSVRIPARMVAGFRTDEYNSVGGYYMVRQAHAHTWVEVLTPEGWKMFDPTSGREATHGRAASLWQSFKHLLDFVEYKWAESVIAYDSNDRDNLLRGLEDALERAAGAVASALNRLDFDELTGAPEEATFWRIFLNALLVLVGLLVATILVAIAVYLVQRRRLRRRAARIGLDALPRDQQMRLARQLLFYDQAARLLARHGIVRPRHLTHREFAESLVFLPAEAYDAFRRLTRVLYRVRFGDAAVPPARQRRLLAAVSRAAMAMERLPAVRG